MRHGNNAVRIRLKGINTVRRYRTDGSFALYRYHRATGRQLTGEPGIPEFVESYAAAERSLRDRAKGTVASLDPPFRGLAAVRGTCGPKRHRKNIDANLR